MTDNHVLKGMPKPLGAVLIGNVLNHIFFKDFSQGFIAKATVADKFEQYFRINIDEAMKIIDNNLSDFVSQNFKGIVVIREPAGFAFEAQARANANNYNSTVPSIVGSSVIENVAKPETKAPTPTPTPVVTKEEPKTPSPVPIVEEPKAPTPPVRESVKVEKKDSDSENIPPKLSDIPELVIDWDKISAPQKVTKKSVVA